MVVALTGIVCADQVVPAVHEIQSLSTSTAMDVVGLTTETDAGTWTLTNDPGVNKPGSTFYDYTGAQEANTELINSMVAQLEPVGGKVVWTGSGTSLSVIELYVPESLLDTPIQTGSSETFQEYGELMGPDDPTITTSPSINSPGGIHTGALDPGQIQYTTTYDANIVAQAGHTSFVKSMNLDTRNKVLGQSNIDAKTALTYIATADGGNVVGSENILIDGAGMNTTASDRILCPFAAGTANVIPAYCNIVQAGSTYDLTVGSVTTNANDRFVGNDATNPVVLNYDINVKPYGTTAGQIPAIGSALAYIKADIQEGRVNGTVKDEDLTYNEQSSAQGSITAFTKVIAYQSGKALL